MRKEERVTWALRSLYEKSGYSKYRMSRFEEYELYLQNKNFLKSRQVITFNDMDGRLLALRPDVTLSIVNNTHASAQCSEKFYYLENVYRVDRPGGTYREISQLGLEYLGAPDVFSTGEVVALAARTLGEISPEWRMQISNVAFVSALMESLFIDERAQEVLAGCIRRKNEHELNQIAREMGMPPAAQAMLARVCSLCGPYQAAMARARDIAITPGMTEALNLLDRVFDQLEAMALTDRLTLDFSLLGDMEYYSGVAFQGYVPGVPRAVLSGGCYANLLKKFGRDIDAIGFALYLDELSLLYEEGAALDADVLLLYDADDHPRAVAAAAQALRAQDLRVRCDRRAPADFRCARTMTVKEAGTC